MVVGEEEASTIETVVKPATIETAVKPATIETVVKPEVAKPEATETTLAEVVEAATAKQETITASAAELTASAAELTTAPVCRLR